jgi:aldehyde:ferredoxin oxidoreductase
MALACIGFTDMEGIPTRHAGRGGLGAVMGSKGIKAIVVDDCGSKGATFADEDVFRVGNQKMVDALTRHPVIKRSLLGQSCSPGCLICCPGESKHNNNWFFSRYLGIEEPGDRNLLNQLCDDYGIDTFETSAAIGVAITAGLLKLGDSQAIISMLREIARATILGRVLGAGSDVTRKVFAKVDAITVNRKHTIAHKRKNSEVFDNAGLCKFVSSALIDSPEGLAGIVQMCNARYGWNNTVDDF